jgi:hypothetical protein
MMPRNGSRFGPHRRSAPQISWRHRKRQHFRHRPRIDPKTPGRFPLTDSFYVNCSSYLRVCFPPASSLRPPLPLSGELAIADGFLLRCNRSIRLLYRGIFSPVLTPA